MNSNQLQQFMHLLAKKKDKNQNEKPSVIETGDAGEGPLMPEDNSYSTTRLSEIDEEKL